MDQLKVDFIVEKIGEIKLLDDTEGTDSKKEVSEEKDVLVNKTESFIAVIPIKERRRRLSLRQESIKGNWRIFRLV